MASKVLFFVCFLLLLWLMANQIISSYKFDLYYGSYWKLADRASSIPQKADYINKFYTSLAAANLASHDALFLDTAENSRDANLGALKSLSDRLFQIQGMDVKSFEYQQAISQITAQEQGEAGEMIGTLRGCWKLGNGYWMVWDWIGGMGAVASILGMIVFGVTALEEMD